MTFYVIEKKNEVRYVSTNDEEIRAVFLSYIELEKYIKDKTSTQSKDNIIKILDNLKNNKFNFLILHVRPFSDAIYESKVYPISDSVKAKGEGPSYDILKYIIDEAHKREISVHAWINPYRISTSTDASKLNSLAKAFYDNKDAKIVKNKGIYYDPSSENVSKLILSGVKELVKNYNIDGIKG